MISKIVFLVAAISFLKAVLFLAAASCDEFDENIRFVVHKANSTFEWPLGTKITPKPCPRRGNFSFIVHGWQESTNDWALPLIKKLQKYRGGCVMFMNWSRYSDGLTYDIALTWPKVATALTNRLKDLENEGVSGRNMFMYGFSVGGRIVILSGLNFGRSKIANIDICDNAGPGFHVYDLIYKPKNAAKNVQCIHTCAVLGTMFYDCHQNWLMASIQGRCGISQPGENVAMFLLCQAGFCPQPESKFVSHDLCNQYYISAFENDFVADNRNKCTGVLKKEDLPPNFKMGFMETRRNPSIVGKIAAPTTEMYPYNVQGFIKKY